MNKFLLVLFICTFYSSPAESQLLPELHNGTRLCLDETAYIMKQLGIDIRPNIDKDGILDIGILNPTLPNPRNYFSLFNDSGRVIPRGDTALRYYKYPYIALKESIFKIFYKQKDTTQIGLIVSVSSVIHEMTHYLQLTYDPQDPHTSDLINDYYTYINYIGEIESRAVQSYYFLYYYNRQILNAILAKEENKIDRFKELINAFNYYAFPNEPLPYSN